MSRCGPRSPREHPPDDISVLVGMSTSQVGVAWPGRVRASAGSTVNSSIEPSASERPSTRPVVVSSSRPSPWTTQAWVRPSRCRVEHHRLDEPGIGDTDHLAAHPAGIGHRSEQVECGRHADLATWGPGEPKGRVEHRREAEADPGLADTGGDTIGMEFDRDAQQLQQVGAAALRRRGAIAVLAHRHAGPGDDQRRHRRHVDRVDPSPPVPTMSTHRLRSSSVSGTMVAWSMALSSNPVSSSTCSPLARSATRNPAICAAVASPRRIVDITSCATDTSRWRAGDQLRQDRWPGQRCARRHRVDGRRGIALASEPGSASCPAAGVSELGGAGG